MMPAQSPATPISGRTIAVVELLDDLKPVADLMSRTCEFFFKGNLKMDNAPFKGFLLEGPPGTGKTEVVRQVASRLDRRLGNVFFLFVDGASIAAPKWGEAETLLRQIFEAASRLNDEHRDAKLIVLFDDIESLMISRGAELAKEWHYSINSILFHELDRIDPSQTLVCATTNRPDLVDMAIRTRLYPISAPTLRVEQLMKAVDEILNRTTADERAKKEARNRIQRRLSEMDAPTIRDARQITIVECIEGGVWSA